MLNIIICGAPGSGKGTQSDFIVEKYNLKHFSTGDMIRQEIEKGTEWGKIADSYISKGNFIPDEMIIDVIIPEICKVDSTENGFILDGFPRNIAQSEALESVLNRKNKPTKVLLDLRVDNAELTDRLLKRGLVSGRSDDNAVTIKRRLEVYDDKTIPVSDYYRNINKYAAIDGSGTFEEVFERIVSVLDPLVER